MMATIPRRINMATNEATAAAIHILGLHTSHIPSWFHLQKALEEKTEISRNENNNHQPVLCLKLIDFDPNDLALAIVEFTMKGQETATII